MRDYKQMIPDQIFMVTERESRDINHCTMKVRVLILLAPLREKAYCIEISDGCQQRGELIHISVY